MSMLRSYETSHNIQMQVFIDYNFLIIGRSGSGKSATSKLLTGDPSITVANSLNQVTRSVSFYRSISHGIGQQQVRFGILDIPGLDKVDNRFLLREVILNQLQRLKIVLHGIIYIASLTQRDTVEKNKLFDFLTQLPWQSELKKAALIPIMTKYDNFMIDSPEEDIKRTIQQFESIFNQCGYQQAWNKHIFWVNFTKSLEFKMKISESIRQVYQNQIENFYKMVTRNKKNHLSVNNLKQYIEDEEKYTIEQFTKDLKHGNIPLVMIQKSHRISLHIKIQTRKLSESMTAVSASSIGLMISRALTKDLPAPISCVMMGIPLSLALINMTAKKSHHITDKIPCQQSSNSPIFNYYSKICQKINNQLEQQWTKFNKNLDFFNEGDKILCKVNKSILSQLNYFDCSDLKLTEILTRPLSKQQKIDKSSSQKMEEDFQGKIDNQTRQFSKVDGQKFIKFYQTIPELGGQKVWDPIVQISYKIKAFDQTMLIKLIEQYRANFSLI